MGMVPELAIAVLACARIGAIHSVVFGGFSAQSIADRLTDAQAEFIVTSDGAFRGNKEIGLKSVIDDALVQCRFVKRVIVLTRTRTPVSMIKGRDVWWEDEIRKSGNDGQSGLSGGRNGRGRSFVHLLYFRIYRKAERRRAFECGLYGVHHLFVRQCISVPPGRDLLLYSRHWLDHRTQLYRVRSARRRRHLAHVRRGSHLAGRWKVLGYRRQVPREYPLHRAYSDPFTHGIRTRAVAG